MNSLKKIHSGLHAATLVNLAVLAGSSLLFTTGDALGITPFFCFYLGPWVNLGFLAIPQRRIRKEPSLVDLTWSTYLMLILNAILLASSGLISLLMLFAGNALESHKLLAALFFISGFALFGLLMWQNQKVGHVLTVRDTTNP